jgi:hypothetical protein
MTKLNEIHVGKDNKVLIHMAEGTQIIGELHENTLVIKRDPEKHLMRRWNAYGINAQAIDELPIEFIVIEEGEKTLMVSKQELKANGRFYQEEGQEPQYFIDRDSLTKL